MGHSLSALPQGHQLSEYRIERVLGIGGFGVTYLATDTNLNLPVALKEYLPKQIAMRRDDGAVTASSEDERPTFEWGLARFLDEARTLAAFRHPNIVRVMRFFQANDTAYMVMEFVQGATLSEWIKPRRPLPPAILLSLIRPIAEGLDIVHGAGFLHRDIKPGNIFIRDDGSPVLLDFGAARAQSSGGEMTALVSPGYAPLEQYSQSSEQGPWSDLYALGGVMYWMVTGEKPVDATTRVRIDPQLPALDVADRDLYPETLLRAIDWALAPNEAERPQSVKSFLNVLPVPTGAAATTAFKPFATTRTMPLAELLSAEQGKTELKQTLDPNRLKEIETELAKRIGPLASVLVKKAAQKSRTLEEFIDAVSNEIEDEDERTDFSRRLRESTQPPSKPSGRTSVPSTQSVLMRFDAETLEKAERRLAEHIGAIAKVIVKKAAMKARDKRELYLLLSDEIDDPVVRKAFARRGINQPLN